MNVNNDLLTFTKQKFHAITNITQFVKIDQDIFSLIQILNIPFIELQFGIFKCYHKNTYIILSKHTHAPTYSSEIKFKTYDSYDDLVLYFINTFLQDRYINEDVFRSLLSNDIDGLRSCIEKIVRS
jgi:hypothetical protein